MKKLFFSVLMISMCMAAPQAQAQAFLNKMKDKAQQAVSEKVNDKLKGTKVGGLMDKAKALTATSETNERSGNDVSTDAYSNGMSGDYGTPSSIKNQATMERKSTSMCSWDESLVTPSTTKIPATLLSELPAVPSVAELVSPTEEKQKAYYMAIKRVTLRAEQLNEDESCDKQQEKAYTEKLRQELRQTYGLTDEEIALIESDSMTEEQQEALGEKIVMHMMGGANLKDLEKMASRFENSEAAQEAALRDMETNGNQNMEKAMHAVIDKHAAELPKHLGITAAEMKAVIAVDEKKAKATEAQANKLQAKSAAYKKGLSADARAKAEAFEGQLQQEMQEAAQNAIRSTNPMFQLAETLGGGKQKAEAGPMVNLLMKLQKYHTDLQNAYPNAAMSSHCDEEFSAADAKRINDLKAKIFATDDPAVYNPLYEQALQIISTYRQRAAQNWRTDIVKRVETIKQSLPAIIKINQQAIADELIPECMLYRIPMNLVIEAGDVLCDAYSEFPSNYPPMYNEEVIREVNLNENEYVWWPEFYVVNSIEDLLAGRSIYKASDNGDKREIYQFNAGKWERIDNLKVDAKVLPKTQKPQGGTWTSSDGKRTVTYVAEGGYMLLPEGDEIHPMAVEKRNNSIIWVEIRQEEKRVQVVKCTYKL